MCWHGLLVVNRKLRSLFLLDEPFCEKDFHLKFKENKVLQVSEFVAF